MKYETSLVQTREEWSLSASRNSKNRRRRPSNVRVSTNVRAGYHNTSHSPRFTPGPSPKFESPSPLHQYSFHQSHGQLPDLNILDFYDIQGPTETNPGSGFQDGQSHHPIWFPSSPGSHTLASYAPDLNFDDINYNATSTHAPFPLSESSLDMSWTDVNSMQENANTDRDNTPSSEVQAGSYPGANNAQFMTPGTVLPSNTDQYGFRGISNIFEFSPPTNEQLFPPVHFRNVSSPPLNSPTEGFLFEDDTLTGRVALDYGNLYPIQANWTPMVPSSPNQSRPRSDNASPLSNSPPSLFTYQPSPTGRDLRLPTPQSQSYGIQLLNDEYLKPIKRDPGSPTGDGASDSWVMASKPSSSYALSFLSPSSNGSPVSHNSPTRPEVHQHSHVFDTDARVSKPKGRQRSLTTKEKKDAREVRDAKACWACHISKTKCSPCSPGKPCAQCDRLVGKRRFCKFDCFNDPLETLYTFMVPDYNMLQFTESKVNALLSEVGWGTQKIRIRLSWGYYRTLLQADVVNLTLRYSNVGSLGFQHHAIANGANRPTLLRKPSPPLGITQDSMSNSGIAYSEYIEDIINNDLWGYVSSGAYDEDDSQFSKRLLWTICSFYLRGLQAEEECTILKKTIEMHITSTILERSLILDSDSIEQVQTYLQQPYPARSAPRVTQRQIKLTFFTLQRERIVAILKEWGALMWTIHNATNNSEKWAIGFSTFIMLTLVIDKTLGSAYYLCESRIEHRGAEAEVERKAFRELINLTETKLFSRCKEIFHWKFKTRKAGKEACNPIRDGMDGFKGRPVSDGTTHLVGDLQALARDFDREIREHRTLPRSTSAEAPYTDVGRLACIFLDDFLEHI